MFKKYTQGEIVMKVVESSPIAVPSWELQKRETEWGWLGTSGDRAARKLAEEGLLERTMVGKFVYYSLPQEERQLRFL
jgi:hypothetical protein